MAERNNVRTVFRNIRVQQPVRTLEPFAIAERTAQRVDPLADLLQGVRVGGMLGSIASQGQARAMGKLQREEFLEERDRDRQIRDIANQSVTVNAETGQLELDPDTFKAGLMAGGFGREALQMQQTEDTQQAAAERQRLENARLRAQAFREQAQGVEALRPPQPRQPTTASIAMEAAGNDPQKAMELMAQQRRAGRPATTVNVGPQGQQFGNPPKETVWARNADGTVALERNPQGKLVPQAIPIPGTKRHQEIQKQLEQRTLTQRNKAIASNLVTGHIKNVFDAIRTSELPTTGLAGLLMSYVPAVGRGSTGARSIANYLETIRANVGFDKLQQMREASPTGGAVGQVSDFENRLMQATLGVLSQSQGQDDFVKNLVNVHDIYMDVTYGPGFGPARYQSLEDRYPDPTVLQNLRANQTIETRSSTQEEPAPMGLPTFTAPEAGAQPAASQAAPAAAPSPQQPLRILSITRED